ncbi:MAG: DUF411 domain-containing protein [Gemmatimonadaceae bacterium]|jgi:hypothetical protein|nr:DUF411 domain-containing protein [Gemmatimonadaceae bacterium]
MSDALDCRPNEPVLTRRQWLTAASHAAVGAAVLGLSASPTLAMQPQAVRTMTVYKSPTCGCCKAWIEHVEKAGFRCTARDLPDLTETKAAFGIPRALESCHTAQIGRYLVEGHVPADLILRLLREQPDARGLAVPGMPIGSPGMEGGTPEKYDVLLFDRAGRTRVYASR